MNTSSETTSPIPSLALECLRRALEMGNHGHTAKAIRVTRGVLSVYPRFAPAWNALGSLYVAERQGLPAAIALSRCLELDPGHAPANITVGEIELRTGNVKRARTHFETALERPEDLSKRRLMWATALKRRCSVN